MNEKSHKCLILMCNLKVSKQTRSEASKNKVIIKRVSLQNLPQQSAIAETCDKGNLYFL